MPLTINQLDQQKPFITKDGSTIRSILDHTNAPVKKQSLAEATVPAGGATERHYHKLSEEFYFILDGAGMVEIDGESRHVKAGDASGASRATTRTATVPAVSADDGTRRAHPFSCIGDRTVPSQTCVLDTRHLNRHTLFCCHDVFNPH